MTKRVIVFLDWQNVYSNARRLFHNSYDPYMNGQVDPVRLGQWLASRNQGQSLTQVRAYRGLPDATKQPKAYAANERQTASWVASGVEVTRRPLQYPKGWPDACAQGEKPREKGIDVALAIDFVRLAIEDKYDVGILVSGDTDLKPALEFAWDYKGGLGPRPETAAWSVPDQHCRRLGLAYPRKLWCHWMDKSVYGTLQDPTDYTAEK